MSDKEDLKKIIDDFFNNASPKELYDLQSLLEKHERKGLKFKNINFNNIASNLASKVQEHMGVTSEKMAQTARNLIRDMILQYDPHIPENKLQMLLDQWSPDFGKKWKKITTDLMLTMSQQFVAYGKGELNDKEKKEFPEGWMEKYWAIFPTEVQRLIQAFLRNKITKREFWNSVEAFLDLN